MTGNKNYEIMTDVAIECKANCRFHLFAHLLVLY